MEYMRKEYDNLHSHIEASETRITKELRDKAEVQAQEASAMDEGYWEYNLIKLTTKSILFERSFEE